MVALGLVLLKQLQPYVQELSDVKHVQNYMPIDQNSRVEEEIDNLYDQMPPAVNSTNLEGLENCNITLKQREEDNKLSFMRNQKQNNSQLSNIQSSGVIEEYDEAIYSQKTAGVTGQDINSQTFSQTRGYSKGQPVNFMGFASQMSG